MIRMVKWSCKYHPELLLIIVLTLALHMAVTVVMTVGMEVVTIEERTSGLLTGTRTAVQLAALPVADVMIRRAPHWRAHGIRIGQVILTVMCWIDNLYGMGKSYSASIKILDDFETCLWQRWRLRIGADSRAVLPCRGQVIPDNELDTRWPIREILPVLGHLISDDGSCTVEIADTFRTLRG